MIMAIFHGSLCFWIPIFSFKDPIATDGCANGHWFISTFAFTLVIHVIIYKLMVESVQWN